MFYDNTLVQMVRLDVTGNLPKWAVRTIAKMEYFEFDNATEGSIKKYLALNHAAEGYYQVVGENDSGFDRVLAIIYFRPKVPNERKCLFKMMYPDDETKKSFKEWVDSKSMSIRCYNTTAKSGEIPIAEYVPKEYEKVEIEDICSTKNITE